MTDSPPHRPRAAWVLGAFLMLASSACRTWNPPPLDLDQPGWRELRGQAVWQPRGEGAAKGGIAGELLLAMHPDGRAYVQFSKGPIVLAEARLEPGRWSADFGGGQRRFSGPGRPPARLAWNQLLLHAIDQPLADGWSWSGTLTQQWRLQHPSGESIEGAVFP